MILRIFSQDTFIYNYNLFLYILGDSRLSPKSVNFVTLMAGRKKSVNLVTLMAGRKPTPIKLKSTSREGVVKTFKSIPETARELGFSEAAVIFRYDQKSIT